ncbi:MAG: helix-turn-helix transcriptional regulator [Candidatus Micrarchaeia archaeon]|jgi:DNA-binding XRE family transcriptional regulator
MSLGTNIKVTRIKQNISQGDLAKTIGISQNHLCLIEGDNGTPSLATLQKIADSLKTTVSELTKIE